MEEENEIFTSKHCSHIQTWFPTLLELITQLTIKYEPTYLIRIKCTVPTETPSVRLWKH